MILSPEDMISRTPFDSAGVLSLVTVLMCTITTAAQELTTDGTAYNDATYNDATSSAANDNFVNAIVPNETDILEQFAAYSSTGSEFMEQETTISDLVVPDTEETTQSTVTASAVYNTPDLVNTSTSYTHGAMSQVPPFNITPSTEAEDSLNKQAASLEIAVIVLGIIAGLSIICIIILVICLIIQNRKLKTLHTETLMEISKQQRQLPIEKWHAVAITSSNDGIDSGSTVRSQEAGLDTPAESLGIYTESDSNVGVRCSTPTDNVYSNGDDTYVNYNHGNNDYLNQRSHNDSYANLRSLNNDGVNRRSQNNAYGNERSENNGHFNESPQNNEIYNNIRGSMTRKNIHPQERQI